MSVVTRFAPSPTGYLHIGGARTALFNWLFARHHGGKFLLRIEDTDRARSTDSAIEAILQGLSWLELNYDDEPIYQFERRKKHTAIVQSLLESGKAYHCYCSPDELKAMREEQKKLGKPVRYDGRWRDLDPASSPAGVPPVVRFRAPEEGETIIKDAVQGKVTVANAELDDMILLRSDGTPTYMLSVVVDDHDMGITHAVRGNDHFTNAFRQKQLFLALGWPPPQYAHLPLIHGADGAKLSKRHGALGIDAYRKMGILPEAIRNYLLRLGWGHGNDEIISAEQAIEWFDLNGVGKAPARFDLDKMTALNGHYLREADNKRLVDLICPLIVADESIEINYAKRERLERGMNTLKERARTLIDLASNSAFYVRNRPLMINEKAKKILDAGSRAILGEIATHLDGISPWSSDAIEQWARSYAEENHLKLAQLAQPLRAALTGSNVSPPVFGIMEILGRSECIARVSDALSSNLLDK